MSTPKKNVYVSSSRKQVAELQGREDHDHDQSGSPHHKRSRLQAPPGAATGFVPPGAAAAAAAAANEHPMCTAPRPKPPAVEDGVGGPRLSLIMQHSKKWVSGTTLRYFLWPAGSIGANRQRLGPPSHLAASWHKSMRDAFQWWLDTGIDFNFVEVNSKEEAQVVVGFTQGDGSWSYVGRDILKYGPSEDRTMNIGWDPTDAYGFETCVHEIGHTLGFSHEHQNPKAGIRWDEPAVIEHFGGQPNYWPEAKTRHNIIDQPDASAVLGSNWDPASVMHYQFAAGLILKPEWASAGIFPSELRRQERDAQDPPILSSGDRKTILEIYPPARKTEIARLEPGVSWQLDIGPGEQASFAFEPPASRNYTFVTFGDADTVMVLMEEIHGEGVVIAADDDSGYSRNARIRIRLMPGRRYILRLRLYSRTAADTFGVIVF